MLNHEKKQWCSISPKHQGLVGNQMLELDIKSHLFSSWLPAFPLEVIWLIIGQDIFQYGRDAPNIHKEGRVN